MMTPYAHHCIIATVGTRCDGDATGPVLPTTVCVAGGAGVLHQPALGEGPGPGLPPTLNHKVNTALSSTLYPISCG